MRVLFVCHRLPYPPSRGGKIRPFNIIKHLTESGHAVTVASLARSRQEYSEGAGLKRYCAKRIIGSVGAGAAIVRMLIRLPSTIPSSMGFFYSPQLRRRIKAELDRNSYDFIVVHCSSVAPYVADCTGIRKFLDFGDMDSQKWLVFARYKPFPLSIGYWLEGRKLERAEKRLAMKFDFCTCTTKLELQALRRMSPGVSCDWFPNGVDSEYFSPSMEPYDPEVIGFVGRMDYFPNQQAVKVFCDDVLPLLQSERPTLRFLIVGAAPPRSILSLGDRPGVEVSGTVSDVRPFVRSCALTVAPLLIARGTQNKIVESMAMGVPVVASHLAVKGVDAEPGKHLEVATTPTDFSAAILRILESPAVREAQSRAARERVLSHHSWEASMRKLDGLLNNSVG